MKKGFYCYSDFTWNQFWSCSSQKLSFWPHYQLWILNFWKFLTLSRVKIPKTHRSMPPKCLKWQFLTYWFHAKLEWQENCQISTLWIPRVFCVKSVYYYSYMILRKNVKNTFIHVILFRKLLSKKQQNLHSIKIESLEIQELVPLKTGLTLTFWIQRPKSAQCGKLGFFCTSDFTWNYFSRLYKL